MGHSKEAFAVVVDDSWYQEFIPFFAYFVNRAYPDATIFLFMRSWIRDDVFHNMSLLLPGNARIKLVRGFGEGCPDDPVTTKALRWTIRGSDVEGADSLYIGDVDITIAVEHSLFESHNKHARFLGVPFSNVVRPGAPRFSGLHFIKVKEYCEATKDAVSNLKVMLHKGIGADIKNESLLYDVIEQSGLLVRKLFWLGGSEESSRVQYRPTHGVHLGVFRGYRAYPFVDNVDLSYFEDLVGAFKANPVLNLVVQCSSERIKMIFRRALAFGGTLPCRRSR